MEMPQGAGSQAAVGKGPDLHLVVEARPWEDMATAAKPSPGRGLVGGIAVRLAVDVVGL